MTMSDSARERFLAASWLKDLDEAQRAAVLTELKEEVVAQGADLLVQGVQNESLIFLVDGTVDVLWDWSGGEQQRIITLEAPAVFGVPSFFRPNPASVTVRACTEARILSMNHESHERIRLGNPQAAEVLALAALRVLADRFDVLDGRLCELMAAEAKRKSTRNAPRPSEWANFRARLFEKAIL